MSKLYVICEWCLTAGNISAGLGLSSHNWPVEVFLQSSVGWMGGLCVCNKMEVFSRNASEEFWVSVSLGM